jgi:hypothetical protein
VLQRVLRGSVATLRSTKHDGAGEPTAPVGAVTVDVTRADGTSVLTAGATTAIVDGPEVTVTVSATATAELGILTAVWTDADGSTWTTTHEIVGGFFFSIAEARASDKTLQDQTKYPAVDILAARAEVEQECEEICGQAFVPRYAAVAHTAASRGVVMVLPHVRLRRIRSVSVDGTAYTAEQVEALQHDPAGVVYLTARRGARVTIAYEHGWDSPPADLKRATLLRLRHRLNAKLSGIPDRAQTYSPEAGGTYSLVLPGRNRTGIPDVDAVYERYSVGTPVVA